MESKDRTPSWKGSWRKDQAMKRAIREIVLSIIRGNVGDRDTLQSVKLEVAKRYGLRSLPTNSMILDIMEKEHSCRNPEVVHLLRKKPSRTLSGVAVVAVMTSPHDCPHGKCTFCPGGTGKEVPTPQSYTGKEPAAMRAAMNDYDPFRQTANRIRQLESVGHETDKIDLILMGGTITARDLDYQKCFVKGCLDAMNGVRSDSLEEAQALNEVSSHRCIGMTFETRPDQFGTGECRLTLALGGTRVELGAQSTFDRPLEVSGRGHGTDETIKATRIAKDSGLKVSYHLMPGLPGSDMSMDVESARRAFESDEFRPDMIKIYPTLVVRGTELYDMWKRGDYDPLDTERAADVVARIKRITPPWVRIQRVQRDIPTNVIDAGVDKSNLRQVVVSKMEKEGWDCRCIRCREVGHRMRDIKTEIEADDIVMKRSDYSASGGHEVFISLEHQVTDSLMGYARLRDPSPSSQSDDDPNHSFLRELKVFGRMVSIGKHAGEEWQHRGLGGRLLQEAETISIRELDSGKMLITSGIGAREYYRKHGYEREGPYMGKDL